MRRRWASVLVLTLVSIAVSVAPDADDSVELRVVGSVGTSHHHVLRHWYAAVNNKTLPGPGADVTVVRVADTSDRQPL
jgi:hypothetical protein